MLKLLTIIGARPQIIKAAALSRAIRNSFSSRVTEVIVHTGQHYDENMSGSFMKELDLPAENYNLGVGSGNHGMQTAIMLQRIEEIIIKEDPDAVIIYGDTNSTLAGSIAAAKIHIPVIHIEAGLRSFNKTMPEEINRICTDHVSTLLFAPTVTAINNLDREGFDTALKPPYTIDNPGIFHCGDIMYDNSLYYAERSTSRILEENSLVAGNYILATVHRNNNTDDKQNLDSVFTSFNSISEKNKIDIVVPLHPRTRKMMDSLLDADLLQELTLNKYIKIIPPVSFLDIVRLESNCKMIMTDSGGVQKEAYFFKKPCIILRDETEWVELVENGCAILTGTDQQKIEDAFNSLNNKSALKFVSVFGDGKAAEFILKKILEEVLPK